MKKVPDDFVTEKVELEDCRYAIKSFLFLRALCDSLNEGSVAENMLVQGSRGGDDDAPMNLRNGASTGSISSAGSMSSADGDDNTFKFRTTDVADDEIMAIGELHNREKVGSETNLEGKTIFRCFPLSEFGRREGSGRGPRGAIGDAGNVLGNVDIVDGKPVGNELYLVVDSSRLYLCEPMEGENGGEITQVACNCPMRNIISSATDGLWLHISLRAGEFMVKPGLGAFQKKKQPGTGKAASAAKQRLDPKKESATVNPVQTLNIALCFDTPETATIVRGMIEKIRVILRRRSVEQCEALFRRGQSSVLSRKGETRFDTSPNARS